MERIPDKPSRREEKTKKSYSELVKACQAYTLERGSDRIYMSELCDLTGSSERTLQNAFREVMKMSPMTYLKTLRLHRVRQELRKANKSEATVTASALNWGFWHFGEFSRVYKQCFGELPSQTLGDSTGDGE